MSQPTVIMHYNAESAAKAGGGDYVSETGAYVVRIKEAKYTKAGTGSDGLEFSVETKDGMKANFLNVYFAKKSTVQGQPGEAIKGGQSIINAMMGLLNIRQITAVQSGQDWACPEFKDKEIGLFLQKKLFTKGDGSDGYGFEICVPFSAADGRTMREVLDNKPAQTVERMKSSYKDKDERKASGHGGSQQSSGYDYPESGGYFG